jgi:Cu(I)/Ag(I) efflux system membrane fusion protein
MASNDQGADWISREAEILNPYFGEKMLKCGTVKDTITKDFNMPKIKQVSGSSQPIHNH